MEIKKKNNRKKSILAIIIVLILAAIGAYAYYYFTHKAPTSATHSSTNLAPATDQEKAAGNQAKSSSTNQDATKNDSSPSPSPSTSTGPTTVSVQTTANAQNGSTYQLRYLINTVANNATCTLTLTQGSNTVTKTASTQALAQSSTCAGFDIPTNTLSPGSWQATMVVSGANITGSVTNTIQVQ